MGDLIKLIALLVAVSASIGKDAVGPDFRVSGVVLFPDGNPSAGAIVTGTTACEQGPIHIEQTTKTSYNGFLICNLEVQHVVAFD